MIGLHASNVVQRGLRTQQIARVDELFAFCNELIGNRFQSAPGLSVYGIEFECGMIEVCRAEFRRIDIACQLKGALRCGQMTGHCSIHKGAVHIDFR